MADVSQGSAIDKEVATTTSASKEPESREARIRRAAYKRYQERSGADGDEQSDWLAAERDIDESEQHQT